MSAADLILTGHLVGSGKLTNDGVDKDIPVSVIVLHFRGAVIGDPETTVLVNLAMTTEAALVLANDLTKETQTA